MSADVRHPSVFVDYLPGGAVCISTEVLGGPSIVLARFEWDALVQLIRADNKYSVNLDRDS